MGGLAGRPGARGGLDPVNSSREPVGSDGLLIGSRKAISVAGPVSHIKHAV
jgi:hypothetical protein